MTPPSLRRRSRIPRGPKPTSEWNVVLGIGLLLCAGIAGVVLFRSKGHGAGAPFFLLGCTSVGLVLLLRAIPSRWRPVRSRIQARVAAGQPPVPWTLWVLFYAQRLFAFLGVAAVFFFLFRERWGRMSAVKVAFIGLLVIAGGVSADVFRPRHRWATRRRRMGAGTHAAREALEWPTWRRAATLITGCLLAAVGIAQWIAPGAGVPPNALAASICLIAYAGTGCSLIGIAMGVGRHPPPRPPAEQKLTDVFD